MIFKKFDYINKITLNYTLDMYEILTKYYQKELTNEEFNNWFHMITNDKNYNIIICIDKNKMVGFLCYMIINNNLIICEIQIIPDYQKKYGIFRKLFKQIKTNEIIDKVKCTIKETNTHSIECFTNMGMINTSGLWYEMNYNNFKNWLK